MIINKCARFSHSSNKKSENIFNENVCFTIHTAFSSFLIAQRCAENRAKKIDLLNAQLTLASGPRKRRSALQHPT